MPEESQHQFPCRQCGAALEFKPKDGALVCPYCGFANPVQTDYTAVQELDYMAFLTQAAGKEETEESLTFTCSSCGAETTLDPNVSADECPFCGTPIVVAERTTKRIKPRSLLPFGIARDEALTAFQKWIRGLWFAPGALKNRAQTARTTARGLYPLLDLRLPNTKRLHGPAGRALLCERILYHAREWQAGQPNPAGSKNTMVARQWHGLEHLR